jgi:mannose-6-phosphate isomerase-like protein (cupin superfamily)
MDAVNLSSLLDRFSEHWAPKTIAGLNDYDVKIVKVLGEFTWHTHADTDELFLVLDGSLTIQMRDRDVRLSPGELFVVPQGTEHCPRADVETALAYRASRCSEHRGRRRPDDGGGRAAELIAYATARS